MTSGFEKLDAGICRSFGRGALHFGLALSVVTLFTLVPGCPSTGGGGGDSEPNPCAGDACDDGMECTDDSCEVVDGEASCTNAVNCADGEECGDDGTCGEIPDPCADVDCDDGLDCTDDSCADGNCTNADNCPEGEVCGDDGACASTSNDDLSGANPAGTFDDLEVGDTITVSPPEPAAAEGASVRQFEDCVCAWSVEPSTAGSFSDADACTTDFTLAEAGDFTLSVTTTCGDGEAETFDQDATASEAAVVDCTTDGDCDDGDVCTDDFCDVGTDGSGSCASTPADCDDGDACTVDTCGVGTDGLAECTSEPMDCGTNGICIDGVCSDTCTVDGDCDDGLFCNGTETCTDIGTDGTGNCSAGTSPCADDQTCDEDADSCASPSGTTFDLTLAQDTGPSFTGGSGDDTFNANLAFNAPTGTNIPTLQTGDSLAGGLGSDVLNATFNFVAATTVSPAMSSIDALNVTDFGTFATTIAGTAVSGLTDVGIMNSTNTNVLTVGTAGNPLPSLVDLSISNQGIGATFNFATASATGASDTVNVTFSNVTGTPGLTLTYEVQGSTNGAEILNITSMGGANTVNDFATTDTSLTTVNIGGDTSFKLTTSFDAGVTTCDASGNGAGVSVTQNNNNLFNFTGGAGDDSIVMGGSYGTTDILNGGEGSGDTLGGTSAVIGGTTANQTNATNFEGLRVSNAHTTAINVAHWGGGVNQVTLDLGSNNGSITNAPSGVLVDLGTNGGNPAGAGTLAVTLSGTGTSDSATLTLNDCDQTGLVTTTGAETLNLVSNLDLNGSAAGGGTAGVNTLTGGLTMTDTAASEKIVVTGTESLTFGAATTCNELDASAFTEVLIMSAANTLAGITVSGGAGADTLFASAGADIVNGNAGNDIINPLAGADIVSGGTGADTFRQSIATAAGVDRQTITDFDDTVTTGDIFNLNSGLATLTGTDNFATSASLQTHSASGNLTGNAAAEVIRVTSGTVSDFTTANSLNGTNLLVAVGGTITGAVGGQNDFLILVADTNGNVGVYYATSANNAIINTEITLVGVLQGSAAVIGDMVFNNFANGA